MSNIIQAIGMIVAASGTIYTAYNKMLSKSSIKQTTATPNSIFILSIGLVIIGLNLIINQASTEDTIGGIVFAIAGIALTTSATMWKKDALRNK